MLELFFWIIFCYFDQLSVHCHCSINFHVVRMRALSCILFVWFRQVFILATAMDWIFSSKCCFLIYAVQLNDAIFLEYKVRFLSHYVGARNEWDFYWYWCKCFTKSLSSPCTTIFNQVVQDFFFFFLVQKYSVNIIHIIKISFCISHLLLTYRLR